MCNYNYGYFVIADIQEELSSSSFAATTTAIIRQGIS